MLSPLVNGSQDHVEPALALFERDEGLDSFDSFLAAAAIAAGSDALVSADRAFAGVDGLRFVDLGDSAELDRLLA